MNRKAYKDNPTKFIESLDSVGKARFARGKKLRVESYFSDLFPKSLFGSNASSSVSSKRVSNAKMFPESTPSSTVTHFASTISIKSTNSKHQSLKPVF